MREKIIYYQGLNGIRAIAAIAVLISHITLSLPDFNLNSHLFGTTIDGEPKGFLLAGFGVSMFFVLSGFLITSLLIEEKERKPIHIGKFYIRRALRIWPLYFVYIGITLIVLSLSNKDYSTESLPFYLFFAPNIPFILSSTIPFLAHYWSLGVEEQFYLFWPWLVKNVKYLTITIIVSGSILIITKLFLHFIIPGSLLEKLIHVTRFHCMMIGGIGAVFLKSDKKWFLSIADNKVTQLICWIIVLSVAINKFHVASVIDNELISIVTLLIIIGQIRKSNRIVNLENKVFNFLGQISFGIYVIHPLLIFLFVKIIGRFSSPDVLSYLIVFGTIVIATIIGSFISYTYLELRFLRIKAKYQIIKSNSGPFKANNINILSGVDSANSKIDQAESREEESLNLTKTLN